MAEFPLVVSPLRLLLNGEPFIRNFRWKPELELRFRVVEKDTGREVAKAASEAAFAFHHVNAYEQDQELVLDLVAYPDPGVIDQLYLSRLRAGAPVDAAGFLWRYFIPLGGGGSIRLQQLSQTPLELPRIDYAQTAGRPHRIVLGSSNKEPGNFLDNLVCQPGNVGNGARQAVIPVSRCLWRRQTSGMRAKAYCCRWSSTRATATRFCSRWTPHR